jgi:actin-related protein 3
MSFGLSVVKDLEPSLKGTPIVVDVGTGYTKVGYACNNNPTFVLPSVIELRGAAAGVAKVSQKSRMEELDCLIGDECVSNNNQNPPERFIKHGLVTNWNLMEKYYEQVFYRYLPSNPEDQPILIV